MKNSRIFAQNLLKSRSLIVKNYNPLLGKTITSAFTGRDLLDWIEKNWEIRYSRSDLRNFINDDFFDANLSHQLIYPVSYGDEFRDSSYHYYRFIEDEFDMYINDNRILNLKIESKGRNKFFYDKKGINDINDQMIINNIEDIFQLEKLIRIVLDKIFYENLSEDGKYFDYNKAMNSKSWTDEFMLLTEKLAFLDITPLIKNNEELLAFFINIYNILNIHSKIAWFQKNKTFEVNNLERLSFFDHFYYIIGGHKYSLNDIEHGILRNNQTFLNGKWDAIKFILFGKGSLNDRFIKNDPRRKMVSKRKEPRIHFALNCGAVSCPPIRLYQPDKLESQLEIAAKNFCNSEVIINETDASLEVKLSSIFKWYAVDFGHNQTQLLEFISRYIVDEKSKALLRRYINSKEDSARLKISYLPYNWNHNGYNN